MRSNVPEFELKMAASLPLALDALAENRKAAGSWALLAGGTDVMVLLEAGMLRGRRWVGINGLADLKTIRVEKDRVEIGSLATYTQLQRHAVIQSEFPCLSQASAETGGLAIQNRGTIGGNIANASPAADSPPALLVYDAELELLSTSGSRWVRYAEFHTGYKQTLLRSDELIATIRLRRPVQGLRHFYRKVGTRKAQAISKVVLAGVASLADGKLEELRLALGSVAPTTLRCRKVEAALKGQKVTLATIEAGVRALAEDIAPIDDIRSTAAFRHRVAGNVLRSFLGTLG